MRNHRNFVRFFYQQAFVRFQIHTDELFDHLCPQIRDFRALDSNRKLLVDDVQDIVDCVVDRQEMVCLLQFFITCVYPGKRLLKSLKRGEAGELHRAFATVSAENIRKVKLETVYFLRVAEPIVYLLLEGTLHKIVTQVSVLLC